MKVDRRTVTSKEEFHEHNIAPVDNKMAITGWVQRDIYSRVLVREIDELAEPELYITEFSAPMTWGSSDPDFSSLPAVCSNYRSLSKGGFIFHPGAVAFALIHPQGFPTTLTEVLQEALTDEGIDARIYGSLLNVHINKKRVSGELAFGSDTATVNWMGVTFQNNDNIIQQVYPDRSVIEPGDCMYSMSGIEDEVEGVDRVRVIERTIQRVVEIANDGQPI